MSYLRYIFLSKKYRNLGLAILLITTLIPVPSFAETTNSISSPFTISVTILDRCLITSTENSQIASYSTDEQSVQNSDFSMICNLDAPYTITLENEQGQQLITQAVEEDGFGYQYHIERDDQGEYVVEACDALVEILDLPENLPSLNDDEERDRQMTTDSAGNVTINIDW